MARAPDHVDELIGQWRAERPDLDLEAMATFGRLGRGRGPAGRSIEEVFARHGLNLGEFDVLAAARTSNSPRLRPWRANTSSMDRPAGPLPRPRRPKVAMASRSRSGRSARH